MLLTLPSRRPDGAGTNRPSGHALEIRILHPEASHSATDLLDLPEEPDVRLSVAATFGIAADIEVPAYSRRTEYVPDIDPTYQFDRDTTLAILAGFAHNRRVLIQGYHGTGKSTHIEQVAARLNWPCIRINLDSHISRIDLIGKDAIVLKDGKQITEYREGILPWSLQRPVALAFDEYDAGRPDVMFVIQRVLEAQGRMTLLDQNKVIRPHKAFRLFATANTVGLGDTSGLYHGTQQINQGQMDRWSIVTQLNYLGHEDECRIVLYAPYEEMKRLYLAPATLRMEVGETTQLVDLWDKAAEIYARARKIEGA